MAMLKQYCSILCRSPTLARLSLGFKRSLVLTPKLLRVKRIYIVSAETDGHQRDTTHMQLEESKICPVAFV
jgi:hypothetical protein